jgi:D-glycero-alpha-D-manno-heptose-7-phosphate kinase
MYSFIRSKSPLRLGLAGGGTDVSPYCDLYGGAILNATINLYAQTTIEPLTEKKIIIESIDRREVEEFESADVLPVNGKNDLVKGIYNRIISNYNLQPLQFRIITHVDVPVGSGLGTSSSLVISILSAFVHWLKLPLGEYEIAQLAYDVERIDLGMAGGRQDQYAAAFGGVNFMEFYKEDKVIVNPLRIKPQHLYELENNLVLYYTSQSRFSSAIIETQKKNVNEKNQASLEAMHHVKDQAIQMKEALLRGKIDEMGKILDYGFNHKKQMAVGISNPLIDEIYEAVKKAGCSGGKISGAGGGGFMFFYCPGNTKYKVIETLDTFPGYIRQFQFTKHGHFSWSVSP